MTRGKQTVSDREILALFAAADAPFLTAREVADAFDLTRQWAHNRLQTLHDDGHLNRKKSGRNTVIWWVEHP
ncbi:helix-turn-helix domain-containing protein [Haloarcula saliterrae]|uniref:helix-turn-helix domain-containing protein n=1 Tax=Haloarcula saliterrae TaxID=2950534 RepID=UPI003AAF15FB